jgi:hypothetical protein
MLGAMASGGFACEQRPNARKCRELYQKDVACWELWPQVGLLESRSQVVSQSIKVADHQRSKAWQCEVC